MHPGQSTAVRIPEVPPLRGRWAAAIAALAVLLAFLAIFRVDLAGSPLISLRHHARWQSQEALRLYAPLAPQPFNVPDLYGLYATYATSPEVQKLVRRDGPLHGSYRALVEIGKLESRVNPCQRPSLFITCTSEGQTPPRVDAVLKIEGTARTRDNASSIATRVSRGLQAYLLQQQEVSRIPTAQRVQILVAAPASRSVRQVQGGRLLGPLIALAVVFVLLALGLVSARAAERRR